MSMSFIHAYQSQDAARLYIIKERGGAMLMQELGSHHYLAILVAAAAVAPAALHYITFHRPHEFCLLLITTQHTTSHII